MRASTRTVLVLGSYRQTLTVIRSVARSGRRVLLGRDGAEKAFVEHSRFAPEIWPHPSMHARASEFAIALEGLLASRPGLDLVFPVGDLQVFALARLANRHGLSKRLVMTEPAVAQTCLDKELSRTLAEQVGLTCPEQRAIAHPDALEEAAAQVGFPCVVKAGEPLATVRGKKAFIFETRDALCRELEHWPRRAERLIIQRYFRGWRHNCHFLSDRGELLAYFEHRVLRTDEPDQTGYCVDGVSCAPGLRARCEALTGALGYSGAGCAQFLVDERGAVCFLELNPRLDASCALPYQCGYDFPRLALEYAEHRRGERAARPRQQAAYPIGRRAAWSTGELAWLVRATAQRRLSLADGARRVSSAVETFRRADHHVAWSLEDPLPALLHGGELLGSLALLAARRAAEAGREWLAGRVEAPRPLAQAPTTSPRPPKSADAPPPELSVPTLAPEALVATPRAEPPLSAELAAVANRTEAEAAKTPS